LNNWINLSSIVRNAYYKSASSDTEWTQVADSAAQTGYEVFIDALAAGTSYYDYKLALTGKTNHLTVFSATQPQDGLLPSSPSAPSGSCSTAGTSITLTWPAVTTNTDSSAITDLLGYEIYRSTDNSTYTQLNATDISTSARTYTDSITAGTTYYYKVTAADDGGNETAVGDSTALTVACVAPVSSPGGSSDIPLSQLQNQQTQQQQATTTKAIKEIITETKETIKEVTETAKQTAQEFAQKIVDITLEAAEVIKAQVDSILDLMGVKRNVNSEQAVINKYLRPLVAGMGTVTADAQHALTNFISYGTPTTKILGAGERAGIVNSYKSAFGKLPKTEAEWNDVIKIGNGRWPSEINKQSEINASVAFEKIYKRKADRKNPHDDAAVVVMAYGLRPADRNMNSEKAAIKSFKAIYGYAPKTAVAWDIVRAIAYSGATR
jgi:hypothetical protein